MLNDLNETIKGLLVEGVPLDISEVDVAFDAPTEEWSSALARPTINCYLYHLVENREMRHSDWEIDRSRPPRQNGQTLPHSAARRHVPFRIDAHYMLTAWANAVEDEHRLVWRMLASLLRYTILPSDKLQGELAGEEWPIHIKVAQPESLMKNPSDFWSGMEMHIKPSVNIIVTLPLDPEMFRNLPLVLTRRIKMYPAITGAQPYELPLVQFGGWVFTPGLNGGRQTVAGASVQIVERSISTVTDEIGRFKFDRVPRGRYTLRAAHAGSVQERVIELPGEDYDLVLPQNEESGSDSDGSGAPEPPKGGRARRR